MGYLNYNLEKVASAVEEGMEKQALNALQLARMYSKAKSLGKLNHFSKRLVQRAQAAKNVAAARAAAAQNAANKASIAASAPHSPSLAKTLREADRTARRTVGYTDKNVFNKLKHSIADTSPAMAINYPARMTNKLLASYNPVPMSLGQVKTISSEIHKHLPVERHMTRAMAEPRSVVTGVDPLSSRALHWHF